MTFSNPVTKCNFFYNLLDFPLALSPNFWYNNLNSVKGVTSKPLSQSREAGKGIKSVRYTHSLLPLQSKRFFYV
jgi:hypothetical protein